MHSTIPDSLSQRSPSIAPQSVKNGEYNTESKKMKAARTRARPTPDLHAFLPSLSKPGNMSTSPRRLNFNRKDEDPRNLLNSLSMSGSKQNKFNYKEVVYSQAGNYPSAKPPKSVMQILRENNDETVLRHEMSLFENFKFPKDMRVTSNVLEIHPQIIKDKLRISKFIHKYFNPALYEKNNMRAIKAIMKLDQETSPTASSESGKSQFFEKIMRFCGIF